MAQVVTIRTTDAMALRAVRAGDDGIPLMHWTQDIGNRFGSAMVEVTEELGFRPGEDDYVALTRKGSATKEFSGLALAPAIRDVPGERDFSYTVEAHGFGALLERIRLSATHNWSAGTPDVKMARDLADAYWSPIRSGATHLMRSRRVDMPPVTVQQGISLRRALDAIAREAYDAPYWVDEDDLGLRWNYHELAPLVLWANAHGEDPKDIDDAEFASFEHLEDRTASSRKALRVRVVGNGVEATVIDAMGYARASRRWVDEPGAPTARFWDLPDVTDTTLTTVTQCRRRGWAELAANGRRRTINVATTREGFRAGQLVDVVDEQIGTLAVPHLRRRMRVPSYSGKGLHYGQGRFLIQRVEAEAIGSDEWRYRLALGAYEEPFAVSLRS